MNSFLQDVAEYTLENYGSELEQICIVLPNKRASLYLRKSLSELLSQPSFMPTYLSIEDLVEEISGLKIIDNISQLFLLFDAYTQGPEILEKSFENFLDWAPVVLSDFNDLDLYMTDIDAAFNFLSEAKAISLWKPRP